jgi:hypothetical protein
MSESAAVGKLITDLLASDARTAVKYLSPARIIKATRRLGRPSKRDKREELVVTIGAPGYRERLFIHACRRAGEPFPVKKTQFKAFPPRKPKAKKAKKR